MSQYSISSKASGLSEVSVSLYGEEMLLEDAVDSIFKDLQTHINLIHCELRQLCMSEDRGDDYDESKEYLDNIQDHVKGGVKVLKDLVPVCKQLMPTKPKGWIDPKKMNTIEEKN